jgi:hypothetical protein
MTVRKGDLLSTSRRMFCFERLCGRGAQSRLRLVMRVPHQFRNPHARGVVKDVVELTHASTLTTHFPLPFFSLSATCPKVCRITFCVVADLNCVNRSCSIASLFFSHPWMARRKSPSVSAGNGDLGRGAFKVLDAEDPGLMASPTSVVWKVGREGLTGMTIGSYATDVNVKGLMLCIGVSR